MTELVTHRRTRQLKGQLTDLNLRNLITRERPYKVADGNGLYVLVAPSGLRAWRWKFRFAGREKVLPLGSYPDVSLAQARSARDEARKKVRAGTDPAEERRDAKLALLTAQENSSEAVGRAWHKVWAEGKHARYAEDVMNRLERNVFPNIGHKPVAHVESKDIVRMMERIQGRGANELADQFEGKPRLAFHLTPPAMGGQRKRAFGPWMMPVFRLLAWLRFLRGTVFDPFGRAAERQQERALVAEYRDLIAGLLPRLPNVPRDVALELARLPQQIRGYGHVKAQTIAAAVRREALPRKLEAPNAPTVEREAAIA